VEGLLCSFFFIYEIFEISSSSSSSASFGLGICRLEILNPCLTHKIDGGIVIKIH
jgi:hypothetical protein